MKDDILTAQQQRDRHIISKMASIGLEAQIKILMDQVIAGDTSKIEEFRHWLRYAPPEMNERLLDALGSRR